MNFVNLVEVCVVVSLVLCMWLVIYIDIIVLDYFSS